MIFIILVFDNAPDILL